jgi:RNA polymerase sigma factor (sigma-70 family)
MQLPVGYFRARTISARDRRDAGPDFHDKRAADPLDELIRREEAEAVRAAVRRLPARNADAVRLRFFDGMPLREIAGEMNASIQCTHSRINSGLAKMADELEAA